jgi:hypothetical protein
MEAWKFGVEAIGFLALFVGVSALLDEPPSLSAIAVVGVLLFVGLLGGQLVNEQFFSDDSKE